MRKNIKRLICLIMLFILICPVYQGALAQNTNDYPDNQIILHDAKNLLYALDIVGDESNTEVTRGRFADIYARVNNIYREDYAGKNPFSDTSESDYADAIEILHDSGIVSGTGNNLYEPELKIMTRDVVKLYVSALGYGAYSQASGKDFMQIAYSIDLFDGVSAGDYITMDNLIIMTYNFLKAPVVTSDFSPEPQYFIDEDKDALYEKFGVYMIPGQVTQNELSGVWSTEGCLKDRVVIKTDNGEVTAFEGESDIAQMLGHNLDIYLYEENNKTYVLCYEKRNYDTTLVIDIENIDFGASGQSVISYEREGKSRLSNAKLSEFPSFIINGVYYESGQFEFDMLKNYAGKLELISTGGSGYDIVIIEAYTNYFVKNVEHYNGEMKIYDTGSNEILILDESECDKLEIFHPNGAKASPFEIQNGMLLSVAKSFGNQKSVTVYICGNVYEGRITGYSSDDRLVIADDGNTYEMSPSYDAGSVYFDAAAKLYIDKFGKIAWIDYDRTSMFSYAYLRKVRTEGLENRVMLEVVAESGKFSIMNLAVNVEIDGKRFKDGKSQLEDIKNVDKIDLIAAGEFPFRYRLNEKGEIKVMDTPRVRIGYEELDSFRQVGYENNVMYSNDGILGMKTALSSKSVVFLIPESDAEDERDNPAFYYIGTKSLLDTGNGNNYVAFKIGDDSSYVDLVIRTRKNIGDGLGHDEKLFLVDKVSDVYDSKNGEVRTKISGLEAGSAKQYFLHEQFKKEELAGIGRGDVVRFKLHDNEITAMDKVYIYNDAPSDISGKYYLPSSARNAQTITSHNYSYYYCGYVMRREGTLFDIRIFDLSATNQSTGVDVPAIPDWASFKDDEKRLFTAPSKISIYDPSIGENGTVYAGDLEDIPSYEDGGHYVKVIVRYRSRSPQEMIVLKDESLYLK